MDWTTIIVAFIGAITGAGGVGGLFQARETRRAKRIENDRAAADEWKDLYERAEEKVKAQSDKIENLFKTLQGVRDELNTTKTKLAVNRLLECKKTACTERDPPFGKNLN